MTQPAHPHVLPNDREILLAAKMGERNRSPRFARPERSGYDSDKQLTVGDRPLHCGKERGPVSFTTFRRMRLWHRPGRSG
jgi:hypothetical protein